MDGTRTGADDMTRYKARLDALAATLNPPRKPAYILVRTDGDEAAAVAQYRAVHDWPDDGAHPVTVMRIDPSDLALL